MKVPSCCKVKADGTTSVRYPGGVSVSWAASEQTHLIVWTRIDGTRKKARRNVHGEAEAVAWDVGRQLQASPHASVATPSGVTVGAAARAFIDEQKVPKERDWSASYVVKQLQLAKHLDEHLGSLTDWTTKDTRAMLTAVGQSVSTRRQLLSLARQTGAWAVGHDLLTINPADGVEVRKPRKKQGRRASSKTTDATGRIKFVEASARPKTAHVERFADAIEERRPGGGLLVRLTAYTGLRHNESFALEGADIDVGSGAIAVDRQVDPLKTARDGDVMSDDGSELKYWATPWGYACLPKGGYTRRTLLPGRLRDACADLGSGPLMLTSTGRYLTASNWSKTATKPSAKAAEWPKRADGRFAWTWHSLRHHAATWMLEEVRLLPHEAADLLGHSDANVTMAMYVHAADDVAERASAASELWTPPEHRDATGG